MKLWLLLLLIFGCFLLTGCPSYSLYPLYTDQDAVVVPALEGTWVDPGSDVKDGVTFQKSGDHGYAMIVDDPSTKFRQTYDVRLVRLGDRLFMDIAWSGQTLNGANLDPPIGVFATHEILKVEILEDDLAYATLEDDAIKKLSGVRGNFLEYRTPGEGALLVTASTDELRRYVAAHAGDVFSSFEHRKKKSAQSSK